MEKALVVVIAFELIDLLVSEYTIIINGAMINDLTDTQLLRVVELRNMLERLRIEWHKIMGADKTCKLMNTAFQDARRYFGFVRECMGDDYCFEQVN